MNEELVCVGCGKKIFKMDMENHKKNCIAYSRLMLDNAFEKAFESLK